MVCVVRSECCRIQVMPERFTWLKEVYVGEHDPKPVAIEGVRFHQELVLLKLVGYDFRDQTDALKGETVARAKGRCDSFGRG